VALLIDMEGGDLAAGGELLAGNIGSLRELAATKSASRFALLADLYLNIKCYIITSAPGDGKPFGVHLDRSGSVSMANLEVFVLPPRYPQPWGMQLLNVWNVANP
jgi:hypothetical protein